MATSRTMEDRRGRLRRLLLDAARDRAGAALTLKSDVGEKDLFAPFSPSPPALIEAVWAKLEREHGALASGDLLVDLGCGDGRWLVSGVNRFGCNALGVELDEVLVQRARGEAQKLGLQHKIQVQLGDVMLADISQAKLVIVYAFAESLAGIAERLKEQLSADASVLSIGFRVPGWKPHWNEREGGHRWYFYRMSDCVGGQSESKVAAIK